MHPLLLDFDGTLVDTRLDLAEGVNRLLVELQLPRLPTNQVMGYVGRGARSLVHRCLDAVDPEGQVGRDETTLRRFLGHYCEVLLDNSAPYPGVIEGLQELQKQGVPMAVVSNKPEAPLRTIVSGLELDRLFRVIVGGDTTPTRKPDAAPLRHAARELGVPLDSCIMVGDSDVDIQAGRNANISAVWCCWGGIHPDRPEDADIVATSFDQVASLALAP